MVSSSVEGFNPLPSRERVKWHGSYKHLMPGILPTREKDKK